MNAPTRKLVVICAADIQRTDFNALAERVNGAIRFHITTSNRPTKYDLPLNRCRTHAEILGWLLHLSNKQWMTREHVAHFIRLACEARGIEVPRI